MSRKFVGKLIRIMMTKSSSCDILKKKRTIRRGSGSRPKGPYLMDLRFWNYVIPDGSTTSDLAHNGFIGFWNYVIPDGSTTEILLMRSLLRFWNYVIPDGSTTVPTSGAHFRGFWNYVIPDGSTTDIISSLILLLFWNYVIPDGSTTRRISMCASCLFFYKDQVFLVRVGCWFY